MHQPSHRSTSPRFSLSRSTFRRPSLFAAAALAVLIAGCNNDKPDPTVTDTETKAEVKPVVAEAPPEPEFPPVDLEKDQPNELGRIPILEYHHIEPKEGRWTRTPANFRKDLDRLRSEGYVPVSMMEYINGEMNIPPGKTPVIFTFDDSDPGQFRYKGTGESATLDPDSGVAMMRAFTEKYPDFPAKATFYVLPSLFEQPEFGERKLKELNEWGFEIGNHTYSHKALRSLSRAEGEKELAKGVGVTTSVIPDYKVETIALPLGSIPKDDSILRGGSAEGITYKHHAALLVGAEPAPSPFSQKFKPFRIPRIQSTDTVEPSLTYWLDYLRDNPGQRYRSDGDPKTLTFPKKLEEHLNKEKAAGMTVRAY